MQVRNSLFFAVALLLLGVVGALSYVNAQREQTERKWVSHTYQVLEHIDAVANDVANAESGQRGYLLTGDTFELQRYQDRRKDVATRIAALNQLTTDNPNQQHNIDSLNQAVQAKLADMEAVLKVRKELGLQAAIEAAQKGTRQQLTAEMRDRVNATRAEEQILLQERRARAETASRNTKLAIILGNLLSIGFLVAASLAVNRELQERKRVESALRQSEERFRLAVADVTTYGILTLDAGGRVATWNAGAERIKGYRADEIIGKHFSCFYPQEDVAAGKPEMELTAATAHGRVEDEGWRVRKDGSRFWANVVITAMRGADGKLIGFSKVTRDLTERKNAEENIQKLNHDLEQHVTELIVANRELDSFTHSLAHDLRAPLRHMHGFATLLSETSNERLDAEGQRFLGKILKSSREMGRLVDELLAFARLGRVELQQTQVDLQRLVEEARQQLEPDTQGRSISWKVAQLPNVSADPALLRQVLINLLSNAVKYTNKKNDARIEIGSSNGNGEITVFVRDNGAGFEMEYAQNLFRVFQRLHSAEEFEGTGVGLANVRRIVERHGGRVWAEGQPGQGATFYFSLPVKETRKWIS
jgi:PAS domain S-box-containing protein